MATRESADARPPTLLVALVGVAVAGLLLARSMGRPLVHDEHQFVAPGALLARDGLLPYLDYPYFHVPYLAWLYAAVFLVGDHLLLGARLVSVAAATGVSLTVFVVAWRGLAGVRAPLRAAVAAGTVACLLFQPVFAHASGLAWNHDLPLLLAVLAVPLMRTGGTSARGAAWRLAAAGCLLALATGVRLSYAPLLLPFGLVALCRPQRELSATGRAAAFVLGALVGLAPMLPLALAAPEGFLFGNLGYPALNTAWYAKQDLGVPLTTLGRVGWLVGTVLADPATLATVGLAALVLVPGGRLGARAAGAALVVLAAALPCAVFGALAPSPSWPQYYAAPAGLLVLAVAYGLGDVARASGPRRGLTLGLTAGALLWAPALDAPRPLAAPWRPATWEPLATHEVGLAIARHVGDGTVLTFDPILPLEGGARIVPALATGPFAWRTGPLGDPDRRERLGILWEGNVQEWLERAPPQALLTGPEGRVTRPVAAFAQQAGWREVALPDGSLLYAP